jgi:hypothetical protein
MWDLSSTSQAAFSISSQIPPTQSLNSLSHWLILAICSSLANQLWVERGNPLIGQVWGTAELGVRLSLAHLK